MTRIALIGDRNDAHAAHRAIPVALAMAVERLSVDVAWEWVYSRSIGGDVPSALKSFAGIWCVPGSPYENTRGVIDAIRFARESGRPFLGTCGGFQHALMEYAEAMWGVHAVHPEMDADAECSVIAPLMCALLEVKGRLRFEPGSRLAAIYGHQSADEEYHCRYGVNPEFASRLDRGPMGVAARDGDGSVRAIELEGHPFFIGTLFQPERAALRDRVPPLVEAFVAAAARAGRSSTP